jgi:hypothetical protein
LDGNLFDCNKVKGTGRKFFFPSNVPRNIIFWLGLMGSGVLLSSSMSIISSSSLFPGSIFFIPTIRAEIIDAPTTVEDMAFPARSRRLSSLSLVKRSSSIGRPCKLNASKPNNGPPRFVT